MHARELVEYAGQRSRHRGVGVDDRTCLVAPVQAEMKLELRARLELSGDHLPVEVHDRHLLGLESFEPGSRGRDGDQVLAAHTQVAGRPEHEALGREAAAGGRDLLAFVFQVTAYRDWRDPNPAALL